jgi:hypothetical protein
MKKFLERLEGVGDMFITAGLLLAVFSAAFILASREALRERLGSIRSRTWISARRK